MQTLADRSYTAKEFADSLFTDYMATQKISNYTIEQMAYGFYTSETPDSIYVIGYLYSVNGSTEKYGYKVFVDENESCGVLEEGTSIAPFLFANEDAQIKSENS